MTFFEKEMKRFFANDTLIEDKVYIGKVLTGKLNDATNIKIYWDTLGVADNYPGLSIKIINKANGTVDSLYVKFNDILGLIKHGDREISHYIWDSRNDVSWYGPAPTTAQIKKVMDVVSAYILLYK